MNAAGWSPARHASDLRANRFRIRRRMQSASRRRTAADCIKVVEESGQTTDECLPVAPDSQRVDLATPTFSQPTPITNPLHPTSEVKQVIMGGQVDDKPFRTEVTLLPGTRPIPWRGKPVDTAIIQYVAYLDGRIHEVAMDRTPRPTTARCGTSGRTFPIEDGKVADTEGSRVQRDGARRDRPSDRGGPVHR